MRACYLRGPLIRDRFSMSSHCPKFYVGYKEMLRLLIDKDAKINAVDINGRTALDAALGAYESQSKFIHTVI